MRGRLGRERARPLAPEPHGSETPDDILARLYDLDVSDDPGDLDLYLALADRADGPILELACGTGRVAIPLAEAGWDVTGVDIDPAMLARARRRWSDADRVATGAGELTLVEGDLLATDLGARFALVVLALNSLMLLGDADRQAAALVAMARHLRPGGIAVVDVWIPDPGDLAAYDGRLTLEWLRPDPETRERVAKHAAAHVDAATGVVDLTMVFDRWPRRGGPVSRIDRTERLRLVSAAELVRFATDAGIAVDELAGGYDLEPFGPGAERAVLVGRRV